MKDKITEMVKILFPETSQENVEIVVDTILECKNFGVDNLKRVGHFLAQAREETGPNFKPVAESLNYSSEALKKLFKAGSNS